MAMPRGSYWVTPELLAGRYPEPRDVRVLLEVGVRTFVDLTEENELPSYVQLLPSEVGHHRVAVRDFTCPSAWQVRRVLALIQEEPGVVFLHCRGGRGRTGVIVGCLLVEAGLAPDDALARIRGPETDAQVEMIRTWVS